MKPNTPLSMMAFKNRTSATVSRFVGSALDCSRMAAFARAAVSTLSFSLLDKELLPCVPNSKHGVFNVLDPAKNIGDENVLIAKVKSMGKDDATAAIARSRTAFSSWCKTTGQHRSKILRKWGDLLHENMEDLATIMTLESGKPLQESRGEVAYAASFLDFFASEAIRPSSTGGGSLIPSPFSNADGTTRGQVMAWKEPVGVAAMITPWNFPLAMITRKVGPALAAGCTAVVKPSELTPLSALAAQTLARRAGVPESVFELITASNRNSSHDVGQEFCENQTVKKISFTGSTAVGKLLMKASSDTVKRVSLELGGNAPFIVFDDAELDQAVRAAMASKFRNSGQTCVCADRFLVQKSIEDAFVEKLCVAVRGLRVGPGLNEDTSMGPLISPAAVTSVKAKVDEAIEEGAKCVLGGSAMPELGANFFQPTIVRNVSTISRLWYTETFGPVVAIAAFDTEQEAVEIANDTETGLASYFCSKDMARVFRVAKKLENGMVGVNEGVISNAAAPFGGVKESGLGREGSTAGIEEYLETKYVFLNH